MSKLAKLGLEPLKITCTSTDCTNNLHCFKATREMKVANNTGPCRDCGAELVDWSRLHKQDTRDVRYTFAALKFELIRHKFWHVEIEEKAVNYAKRKGFSGLAIAVESRLRTSVGAADPSRDGRQTPMEGSGNPIHYGQHATASCCRKCMEYWHGIPQGRSLTDDEISYLSELVMLYLRERLPRLTEDGEKVPSIRKMK